MVDCAIPSNPLYDVLGTIVTDGGNIIGAYEVIVRSRRLQYKFTINRNITILRGDSATGKTTLIFVLFRVDGIPTAHIMPSLQSALPMCDGDAVCSKKF